MFCITKKKNGLTKLNKENCTGILKICILAPCLNLAGQQCVLLSQTSDRSLIQKAFPTQPLVLIDASQ